MTEMETAGKTVQNVKEVSGLINDYGATTVILSVFLVLFIVLIIYFLRQNYKYKKEIEETSKLLLDKAEQNARKEIDEIRSLIENNKFKEEKDTRKGISDFINRNAAIKTACKDALVKLNCSRAAVYVFHNGNASLHGLPFYKMSCIGEWSKTPNGVSRGLNHYQMPLHMFEHLISKLYENGEFFVKDISEYMDDNSIYNFVSNTRIKSFYIKQISDTDGNLAGFSICEFNLENTESDKNIREVLQKLNDVVSPIILSSDVHNLVD